MYNNAAHGEISVCQLLNIATSARSCRGSSSSRVQYLLSSSIHTYIRKRFQRRFAPFARDLSKAARDLTTFEECVARKNAEECSIPVRGSDPPAFYVGSCLRGTVFGDRLS